MVTVPEKDWKYLRSLQAGLVERYCAKTLSGIRKIALSDSGGDSLSVIQQISEHISKRDRFLGDALSDFRRSNALWKIAGIHAHGLFADEEYEGFSDEVKLFIATIQDLRK